MSAVAAVLSVCLESSSLAGCQCRWAMGTDSLIPLAGLSLQPAVSAGPSRFPWPGSDTLASSILAPAEFESTDAARA